MNRTSYLIRGFEVIITIFSSYLSITNFFTSSLYKSISDALGLILRNFDIFTSSSFQINQIIPIFVSALVFLLVIYDYAIGKPENIMDIFELNLVLITPEVLSHSRLNWLNLIEKPQLLQPQRSIYMVFFTGFIVIVGYLTLLFTSRHRETRQEFLERGANMEAADKIFMYQSRFTIVFIWLAAIVSGGIFIAVPLLQTVLAPIVSQQPNSYLYLGVGSIIVFIASVVVYFREQENSE